MTRLLHTALAAVLAVAFSAAPDAQERAVDADPGGQATPPIHRVTPDLDDRDPGPRGPTLARRSAPDAVDFDDADDPTGPMAMAAPASYADTQHLDDGRTDAAGQAPTARAMGGMDGPLDDGRTAESAALAEARALAREPYTGPLDDGRPPGTRPSPVLDTDAPEAYAPPSAAAVSDAPFGLSVVNPNPARDRASVLLTAESASRATVVIYDVQGRLVARVFDGVVQPEAPTQVVLDLADLAPGTYVAVMDVAGERDSQAFQVVR